MFSDTASGKFSAFSRRDLFLLGLSLLCVLLWGFHTLHYVEDDAFIHLEFARSLANGHGFAFNGHIVYGDTSPFWVFAIVAFQRLTHDWILASKALSAFSVLLALGGAFCLARRLSGSVTVASALLLLITVNPYFGYWSFSGMEAVAASGMAMWAAYLVSRPSITPAALLTVCLISGLAPVTRPELVFLSAILGVILLIRWYQMQASPLVKGSCFAAGVLLAITPTLLWAWYALHTFGRIMPNTNAAKRAGAADSVLVRMVTVYCHGFPVLSLALAAAILYAAWLLLRGEGKRLWHSLAELPAPFWLFAAVTALAGVFYVVNHTYVQTRYILVTAFGFSVVILALLSERWPRLYQAFLAVGLAGGLLISGLSAWPHLSNKVENDATIADAALWTRQNLPPADPVADFAIGEFAFLSEHPVIDTGGITRPGAVPYLSAPQAAMVNWARSEGARYYLIPEKPEEGAVLVYSKETPVVGWNLNPRYYNKRAMLNIWRLPDAPAH